MGKLEGIIALVTGGTSGIEAWSLLNPCRAGTTFLAVLKSSSPDVACEHAFDSVSSARIGCSL